MRMKTIRSFQKSLFLATAFLSCMWLTHFATSSVSSAITVDIDDLAWPGEGTGAGLAEVVTSTSVTDFAFHDTAGSAPNTLSQSFQVSSAFDVNSIYVNYGNTSGGELTVGIEIFEVADVTASAITAGTSLLNSTFMAPVASENTVMQIFLDSTLPLPAMAGNAGYGIRFTEAAFRWDRTGSSAGSVYAFGKGYENGVEKSSGARDFSLGLSSQVAPPPPTDIFSVQSGNLSAGSTWDSGAPPAAGSAYNVVNTHTVSVDTATFAGEALIVQSGGALDLATDAADISDIEIQPGGTLTSSLTGDFAIGNINAANLNNLLLNESASFSASAGADLFVDADLSGTGDLNFESNGSGSRLFLTAAGGHEGTIRFNGTGDEVVLEEGEDFGTLEMNSTGANRVFYNPTEQLTNGTLIFNQPGEISHAATLGNRRLHGPDDLVANSAITIDLSVAPVSNERRIFIGDSLSGTGDITVNGTASDPTLGSITHNEFETGGTGEPSTLGVDDYSGTITGNDFVDFEIRRSLPDAKIVINNNATLEMGHRAVLASFSVAIGEIEINTGGTLEVGYEEDSERNSYQLTVTSSGTRSGNLTLASGTTTRMQVNGTAAGEFDTIVAQGDVALDGTLELFVNPLSPSGTNPIYAPTLGDTFDIISIIGDSPPADLDGSGTVDAADLALLESSYGIDAGGDVDGDGDTDGADFLNWQLQEGTSGSLDGSITGTFDNLVLVDPGSVMSTAGLAFQINYVSSTLVQLEVIAAPILAASVPEPSTLTLAISIAAVGIGRRRKRA